MIKVSHMMTIAGGGFENPPQLAYITCEQPLTGEPFALQKEAGFP